MIASKHRDGKFIHCDYKAPGCLLGPFQWTITAQASGSEASETQPGHI